MTDRGPKLVVLDDSPFVRTYAGDLRPQSATFNRFVEAMARTDAFSEVRYMVPVRHLRIWEVEPALDPVDESVVDVVPTAFFGGYRDYLLRASYVATRSWRVIDRAIAGSDLLWLQLPAANALLALAAARRHHVPYFRSLADSTGVANGAVTELAGRGGPLLTLDADIFASVRASHHSADKQAESLVGWLRPRFPRLTWPPE